jgi:hypothetical protein
MREIKRESEREGEKTVNTLNNNNDNDDDDSVIIIINNNNNNTTYKNYLLKCWF